MLKVIELSDEQINNCQVFLNRANLTGAEAEALVMIKMALNNARVKAEYIQMNLPASNTATSDSKARSQSKGGDTNED